MPTVCINQPDLRVRLSGERLEIHAFNEDKGKDEVVREIPLRDVDRLITGESVHFSAAAMGEILRRGLPIQFFGWNGRFLGQFLPAQNHHGLARLRQYRQTLDGTFALRIAGRIIAAKLYNQRRVIQRLVASRNSKPDGDPDSDSGAEAGPAVSPPDNRGDDDLAAEAKRALGWLDSLFASIRSSDSIDEVRGYEGAATARYYKTWARFLPDAFPFERRSKRPPLNPVNACISFAATILYNEAVGFIHGQGIDPALGMLHTTENGRWSLALDLIEPFRPVLVEALALDLFSHQILKTSDFENRNGGVLLNEDGRRKFFLQYERRMERQFMSECVGHRTTLRSQLENQAVLFKSALEEPDKFEPFLMN